MAILAVWFAIAGFALLFAVAALIYGVPERGQPTAVVVDADNIPLVTGSIAAGADRVATAPAYVGRSDIEASAPATAPELARLRVENVALRQSVDQLRGQLDDLSDRLQRLEDRLASMTGSLSATETAREPVFYDKPDVKTANAKAADAPATVQFGVELGAFADLNAVKTSWRQLVKTYPNLFAGLEALATVRDRGGATELLLVAGPFRSTADASEHCGKLEAAGIGCQPAFYLGQPLSIR